MSNTLVNLPDDPSYINTNEEAKPHPVEAPVPQQPNTNVPQQPNTPATQQPQKEAPKETTYTPATKTEPAKKETNGKGAGKASITTKGK